MTRRRGVVLLVALVALVAVFASAACGSDNKVGNESLLDFKEETQNRLGETTTTTAAATTTTAAAAATTSTTKPKAGGGAAGATSTTVKAGGVVTTATTAPAQTVREIFIFGDDAELALDPQIQTAYTGSIIRWTNKDTVPRAVRADSGQFASPPIAPGKSWDYTATSAGTFAYGDDTRPYVKGELRVAKKP